MANEVETGTASQSGVGQTGAGAGTGTIGYGAQSGSAGAGTAASTVSRDDIQNIFEAFKNSMDTRFAQLEAVADIGGPEAQTRGVVEDSHKWSANNKRTFDIYQNLELEHLHANAEYRNRSRDHYDMLQGDNRSHINNLRKIELELLQNGNTAAKIGDNRMWTVDTDALEAAAAVAVAKAIQDSKA
jgi:hypothetical protein